MAFEDWLDFCTHTIAWEKKTGTDEYGKPTYAPVATYQGRRVFAQTATPSDPPVRGGAIEEIQESMVTILTKLDMTTDDLIYVVGDSARQPISTFKHFTDENGDTMTKVYLGSAK